eukprot:2658784-Amphidinium_carterae.1
MPPWDADEVDWPNWQFLGESFLYSSRPDLFSTLVHIESQKDGHMWPSDVGGTGSSSIGMVSGDGYTLLPCSWRPFLAGGCSSLLGGGVYFPQQLP